MDDADRVHPGERGRELLADRGDPIGGEHALAAEQGAQVLADQQLHQQVVIAELGRDEVLDLEDVGVADLVDRARLVEEPRDDLLGRAVAVDDLERHPAAELHVDALVDRADATLAEHAQQAVLPEHVAEPRVARRTAGLDDQHRAIVGTCSQIGAKHLRADDA